MRNTLLFIFLLSAMYSAQCQDNFSETFFYSTKNIHVYIPALACRDNQLQSSLILKTYVGKLSLIRSQYADINLNIKKYDPNIPNNSKHILGLGFYSDKEGEFFNKTRVLLRYAVHLPLTAKLSLSAAMALNIINYNFSASGQGASGSDFNWSGNMSTSIYSPTFRAGISFNDMNNPELIPINYTFIAYRYTTLYAEKDIHIGNNNYLRGGGRYNIYWGRNSSFLAHLGLQFSRSLGITSFYFMKVGWGFAFEINKINIYKGHHLDFSFAYQIPNKNHNVPVNQYEINLGYYLKK